MYKVEQEAPSPVPSQKEEDKVCELTRALNIPSRKLSTAEYRQWICGVESQICEAHVTVDRHSCISEGFKLEEALTPGIYTRELTMPKGSLVFSRIHMETHPFMIVKGLVSVYDGSSVQSLEAPYKGVTKAGTKRVLYVHEDTTWITFHPTEMEVLEDIDRGDTITCDTFEEYEKHFLESRL